MSTFKCDLCEQTWDRDAESLRMLRFSVARHLWIEHAIHSGTPESEDHLPMTPEQVAWVREQRDG